MASDQAWRWAIRRAFDISDYVSDAGADQAILAEIVQTIPEVSGGSNHPVAVHRAQEAWDRAFLILKRILSIGPEGKFDDLLLAEEDAVNLQGAAEMVLQGNQGFFSEDRPMIDAVLIRLLPWLRQHPHVPDWLRDRNP